MGRGVSGWTADLAADEFKSLVPNLPLLETIAKETGGHVLQMSDLAAFAKSLPEKSAPIMETVARPIWHTPLLFGIALACLAAEWGLRRWKGLP